MSKDNPFEVDGMTEQVRKEAKREEVQQAYQKKVEKLRDEEFFGSSPRDPERIDKVLSVIRSIWKDQPDLRLGQLIVNAIHQQNLYHIEEDALVEALEDMYGEQDANTKD